MGNNKSSGISIILDRIDSFYFTGETVSGITRFNITEKHVKADEIYVELTGEIGYTTTRTVSNGRHTSTRTEYHHISFYSAKAVFEQYRAFYDPGQYSWPFEIPLADYLPPTINQPNLYPHVRYTLKVVIHQPWYKSNRSETKYITIFPRVNLLQNPQYLSPFIFGNHNRKEITLKGTLNKSGYVPGELVHITIEIENPQRILIKNIDLLMLQLNQLDQIQRNVIS
jgi:hypothetical protein